MPHLPPLGQVSGHHSNNLPGTSSPLSRYEADKHTTGILKKKSTAPTFQEVDRIEAKLWHNRLIRFCKKRIKRIVHPPPFIKIRDLVDDLTENSPDKDVQKVLAALKLHTGQAIKLHQSVDGKLGFTDGKIPVSTKTMEAVSNSIKRNGMEMAYEYRRKGEKLPAGYLQQILIPHIHQEILQAIRYEESSQLSSIQKQIHGRQQYYENPEKCIKDFLEKSGINNEKSFTFERMIEIKKEIRNNIVKSIDEQALLTHSKTLIDNKATNENQPLVTTPKLPEPGKTDHFIEKEDSRHIRKLSSNKRFFAKTHIKDIGNRIKRNVLRNKRNQMIIIAALTAGSIISAIIPPAGMAIGIAVTIGLVIDISYISFWSGSTALWRRVRLTRGLKKIKKYANFDYTRFDQASDKARKKLIQKLQYRCKHKTFTQIYNAYAELEKQAIRLKEMAAKEIKTLPESIAFEKEKACYRERRKKLKSNLFFFDKLIENLIISRVILENRNIKDLQKLWTEKFETMNPIKRQVLFKSISRNKKLIIHGHKIKTKNSNWMKHIIPNWLIRLDNPVQKEKQVNSALESTKISKSFQSAGVMKELAQKLFYRQIKKTIYSNLLRVLYIAGRGFRNVNVTPVFPKLTIDGGICFVSCFFAEMAADYKNTKINEKRMNKIGKGEEDSTKQLFGKRVRTGREEIATLRALAKGQVEPMVDHLLESIKSMEKTGEILKDSKKRSKALGKGQFGAMSDEDAAVIILEHAAWQQLLDKEINSTFSIFHNLIQEKSSDWNREITRTLMAGSKQAILVSTVPDEHIRRHVPQTHQGAGAQKPHQQTAGMVQQLQSEKFLQSIRNRISGKLIQRLRRGEISEAELIQEIASLNNRDELIALQYWVSKALEEKIYQQHEDTLKKCQRIINYIINNKYH